MLTTILKQLIAQQFCRDRVARRVRHRTIMKYRPNSNHQLESEETTYEKTLQYILGGLCEHISTEESASLFQYCLDYWERR